MQMHIGNVEGEEDTSSFSIPEFEFEVRNRLTGITNTGLTDAEGYTLTDSERRYIGARTKCFPMPTGFPRHSQKTRQQ